MSAPTAEQRRSLDEYVAEHAGSAPRSCGELPFDADFFALTPALQCALRANARGEAFRLVRYGPMLDGGHWAIGLVGKGDGQIERFTQSTIECPGRPCGEHYWFKTEPCPAPRVGFRNLVCAAPPVDTPRVP